MDTKKDKENHSTQYNKDFYAWAMHNAALLKQKKFSEIDLPNVIEELESIGRNDENILENRLFILMVYLLQWKHQPMKRSYRLECTIQIKRLKVLDLLKDSPSLKCRLEKRLPYIYELAILRAQNKTGLDESMFSKISPFTLAELLDENASLEK